MRTMSALRTKLYIRADAAEKAAFERAARLTGMSLSVWVRFELRRAAAGALEKAGERADFVPPTRSPDRLRVDESGGRERRRMTKDLQKP